MLLICAYVTKCGPFNTEFKQILINYYFYKDLIDWFISCSEDFAMTLFLLNDTTVGEWNLQGLPSDDLSIQNAIMVTRSSRFPLMIDPQGQAQLWIKMQESYLEKNDLIININNPQLKNRLKLPLQKGWTVIIKGIQNEIDLMLDQFLKNRLL